MCGILALADAARGNFVVLFNAENGCGRLKTGITTAWTGIGGAAFKVGMFQAGCIMLVLRTGVGFENPTYALLWERPSERKVSDGLRYRFYI